MHNGQGGFGSWAAKNDDRGGAETPLRADFEIFFLKYTVLAIYLDPWTVFGSYLDGSFLLFFIYLLNKVQWSKESK